MLESSGKNACKRRASVNVLRAVTEAMNALISTTCKVHSSRRNMSKQKRGAVLFALLCCGLAFLYTGIAGAELQVRILETLL